jgi:hypothetical protein
MRKGTAIPYISHLMTVAALVVVYNEIENRFLKQEAPRRARR